MIRPVCHADLVAVARSALLMAPADRVGFVAEVVSKAEVAGAYMARTGLSHPEFGNGSLELAVSGCPKACEPFLDDPDYASCVILVLQAFTSRACS